MNHLFLSTISSKTTMEDRAISRLTRTLLCIFIKRKLRKYLKNITLFLFLKKTIIFLLGAISEDFEVKSIISQEMITELKIVFKEASCTGQPCYEENRVPKAKSLAHRNYNQVYIFISELVLLKQDKSY